MTRVQLRWLLLATAVAAIGSLLATLPSVAPTHNSRILRRFKTPEVSQQLAISQTLQMNRPGLSAIEVRPVAIGPPQGMLRLELRRVSGHVTIRSSDVPAVEVAKTAVYRFDVPALADSEDRLYEFDISASPLDPATGVAFWATKGDDPASHSAVSFNHAARWASLMFRTVAPDSPRFSLTHRLHLDRPRFWLSFLVLVVSWLPLSFALEHALSDSANASTGPMRAPAAARHRGPRPQDTQSALRR